MFNKMNKYVMIAIYMIAVMSLVNGCRGCSTAKDISRISREIDSLETGMDAIKQQVESQYYTKDELDVRMSIEGYEISKRMLFDNNSIVRTSQRPDDILMEYDKKIKELRDKIK